MIAYRGVDELYWFEIIERSSSVKVGEPTLKQDHGFLVFLWMVQYDHSDMLKRT